MCFELPFVQFYYFVATLLAYTFRKELFEMSTGNLCFEEISIAFLSISGDVKTRWICKRRSKIVLYVVYSQFGSLLYVNRIKALAVLILMLCPRHRLVIVRTLRPKSFITLAYKPINCKSTICNPIKLLLRGENYDIEDVFYSVRKREL